MLLVLSCHNGFLIIWLAWLHYIFSKIAMISTGISGAIIINSKHYRFDLLFKISTIFLTVTTNYLLIPPYGIVGAALATLITICIGSFLSFLFILIKVGIQPFSMQTIKAILLGFFVLGIHFALPTVASFFEETHFMYYILDGFFRTTIIGGLYIGFMLYLNLSPDITALVSKNVKKIREKGMVLSHQNQRRAKKQIKVRFKCHSKNLISLE